MENICAAVDGLNSYCASKLKLKEGGKELGKVAEADISSSSSSSSKKGSAVPPPVSLSTEVKALWSNIMSPRDRWREEKLNELRKSVVVQYEKEAQQIFKERNRLEKAKQLEEELEKMKSNSIVVYRAAYGVLLNDFNNPPTMVKRDLAHLTLALDVLVQTSGREGTAWLTQLLADCATLSMSHDKAAVTAATLSSVTKTMDTNFPLTKLQSALTSWLRGLKAMARTTGYYPPAIPGTDTRLVLLKCLRVVDTIVTLESCATESSRKDVPNVQASSLLLSASPAAKLSLTLLLDGLYFELRTKKAGDMAFPGLSSPCFGACEFAPTQWKDGVDEKDSVDLESWLAGVCSTTLSSLVVRFVSHESLARASLELLETVVSGAAPLSQCEVAPALDLGLCALPRAAITAAYCLLQRMKDYDNNRNTSSPTGDDLAHFSRSSPTSVASTPDVANRLSGASQRAAWLTLCFILRCDAQTLRRQAADAGRFDCLRLLDLWLARLPLPSYFGLFVTMLQGLDAVRGDHKKKAEQVRELWTQMEVVASTDAKDDLDSKGAMAGVKALLALKDVQTIVEEAQLNLPLCLHWAINRLAADCDTIICSGDSARLIFPSSAASSSSTVSPLLSSSNGASLWAYVIDFLRACGADPHEPIPTTAVTVASPAVNAAAAPRGQQLDNHGLVSVADAQASGVFRGLMTVVAAALCSLPAIPLSQIGAPELFRLLIDGGKSGEAAKATDLRRQGAAALLTLDHLAHPPCYSLFASVTAARESIDVAERSKLIERAGLKLDPDADDVDVLGLERLDPLIASVAAVALDVKLEMAAEWFVQLAVDDKEMKEALDMRLLNQSWYAAKQASKWRSTVRRHLETTGGQPRCPGVVMDAASLCVAAVVGTLHGADALALLRAVVQMQLGPALMPYPRLCLRDWDIRSASARFGELVAACVNLGYDPNPTHYRYDSDSLGRTGFGFAIEEWDTTSKDPGPRLPRRLLPPEGPVGWPLLFLLFRSLPLVARENNLLESLMATAVAVGKIDVDLKYAPHGLTAPQASLLDIISTFLPHFVYPKVSSCTCSFYHRSFMLPFSHPYVSLY